MKQTNITIRHFGSDLRLIRTEDSLHGIGIQLQHRAALEPNYNGPEYIFEWSEKHGVAFSDVFWDIKAEKKIMGQTVVWTEDDPEVTEEEVMQFIQKTYIKDEQETTPKNTEPSHNGENTDSDTKAG
jgi:hypothetical protein